MQHPDIKYALMFGDGRPYPGLLVELVDDVIFAQEDILPVIERIW